MNDNNEKAQPGHGLHFHHRLRAHYSVPKVQPLLVSVSLTILGSY